MGHDSHFLSRLDRVTSEECELALGLYRDHEVVKKLLDHSRLPERAERVAISMDHPREGPFIIVARNGHFVTCLGKGMHVHNHPVITRGELDAVAAKVQTLREQLRRAREVAPTDSELSKLMKRVGKAGHVMPAEDFEALALWAPMMWGKYLLGFFEAFKSVEGQRVDLVLGDASREPDDVLEGFWKSVFGMGHLALLSTLGDPEPWKEMGKFFTSAKTTLTQPLVDQRLAVFAMKAMWMAGRIGEPLIDSYELALLDGEGRVQGYDAILGLAGIAAMNPDLRPRVAAIFGEGKERWAEVANPELRRRSELIVIAEQTTEMTDFTLETLKFGAQRIVDAGPELAARSEYVYASLEAVPERFAVGAVATVTLDWWEGVAPLLPFTLLPLMSRIEAPHFYLPRGLASRVAFPWSRDQTIDLLVRPGKGVSRRQPIVAPEKPGRNEPCVCGSGKKYKRCHGA